MRTLALASGVLGAVILASGVEPAAQTTTDAPAGPPAAVIDLATDDGLRLVEGRWRYRDVTLVEVAHRAAGADLRPSGPPNRTYDIEPHAGRAGFDDSAWEILPASQLQARKGNGRLSFSWYRTSITIPDRLGAFDATGSTVVFEIVVDDYAEVWVDGELARFALQGREALRGKAVILINDEVELAPAGLFEFGPRQGGNENLADENRAQERGVVLAELALGEIDQEDLALFHELSDVHAALGLRHDVADDRLVRKRPILLSEELTHSPCSRLLSGKACSQ